MSARSCNWPENEYAEEIDPTSLSRQEGLRVSLGGGTDMRKCGQAHAESNDA
ncbi:hypothetical protein [Blastopirellula retiformator]|uniref:Uncharacterized protein n=1 Tax=Blastopirellula retiformator TaxID=2527970 RepID=A0A5C5VLZ0_9BACT|nr:hypothetical protein [Blastopirellula retiformator]TWT38885.1 hypothetical protein Enr8_05790 [Blastopirellula retiformator]